jgi:UDPglucose 6-dehydrogenase
MKITVLGLWHLGCVTAACCARHFQVVGLDFDAALIEGLERGKAPLLEPGLDDLLAAGAAASRLTFSTDAAAACEDAHVLWVTYDTPVNDADEADVEFVLERVRTTLPHLSAGTLVLISSQLPVESCAVLEREFPDLHFACSPENLRLGRALDAFEKAERVIVGVRSDASKELLQRLFAPFTSCVIFMRTESAEMVKHALNSFFAVSITFINEVARLCEHAGADAAEVTAGLKSEPRIGPRAYLAAGGPFAGGTLARDVVTLGKLGERFGESLEVIPAIKRSNDVHRGWMFRRLQARFGDLHGRTFALLGLTYTTGTDTLRRSVAVELCQQLLAAGAVVRACDPAVKELPADLAAVRLGSLDEITSGADAVIVCTQWPEFRQAGWPALLRGMRQPVVVDANRFLEAELLASGAVEHLSVGRST